MMLAHAVSRLLRSERVNRPNVAASGCALLSSLPHPGASGDTSRSLMVNGTGHARYLCWASGKKVVTVLVISTTLTVSEQMQRVTGARHMRAG